MPTPKSVLAWVKNNWSMGICSMSTEGSGSALKLFIQKEKHAFIRRIPDVIVADRTVNSLHPTEKPVELMKIIISANEGNTIRSFHGLRHH